MPAYCSTSFPFLRKLQSRPRVDTLRGGEIVSVMGMDFEQALKVRQGSGVGRGLRSSRGSSLYGKALHGVDGRTHVKDKGLPWRRVDTNGQIQHNPTLALVHLKVA